MVSLYNGVKQIGLYVNARVKNNNDYVGVDIYDAAKPNAQWYSVFERMQSSA